jgi:hypothetical protein
MPLLTRTPPEACSIAFSNGLPAFLSGGVPSTVVSETFVGTPPSIPSAADVGIVMSGTTPGAPNVTAVLQAFVLTLQDAATNTGVIKPAYVGWNFFAGDSANATVVGRMVHRRHAWKLVAVHYGSLVFETLNLARLITSAPPAQVDAVDYDLRLLAIPGLNLEVFWLAARNATSTDFVVHTPTAPLPALHLGYPNSPLLIQNFLTEIRPLAASLLAMPATFGA